MIYIVKLLKGVNDIEFGMPASQVRKMLSGNFVSRDALEGVKGLEGKFFIDRYPDEGVTCHYDNNWILEAMGFHDPAVLIIDDVNILNLTSRNAAIFLKKIDENTIEDEEDCTSKKYSITFRKRDLEGYDPESIVNFLIAGPNYFDFLD